MGGTYDEALEAVALVLRTTDPKGERFARTLRRTFDQIYDGRNTGRYSWEQLRKTEKTHFGSLIEINLQREFRTEFGDGVFLDYQIAGHEVDCKWAQMNGKADGVWMLPPEVVGHLCLVVTGSDDLALWSAGLVRADETSLTFAKGNRDAKKYLSAVGRDSIHWIWRHAPMPENILLRIDPTDLKAIMFDLEGSRNGQKRVNELFRRVPNRIVGRSIIATVAQQHDYMKRVRDRGGAREHLRPEGIVVFGDYHRSYTEALDLPPIADGDSMSARLIRVAGPGTGVVEINGAWYRLCRADEEPTKPAPILPKPKGSKRT